MKTSSEIKIETPVKYSPILNPKMYRPKKDLPLIKVIKIIKNNDFSNKLEYFLLSIMTS